MQTVLLLDDSEGIRKWLTSILHEAFPDAEILEADSVTHAQELCQQKTFSLAVLDVNLPDGDGIKIASELAAHCPHTYIVMLTVFDDDQHLFRALKAGAHGYLLKDEHRQELVDRLRGILRGEPPLSPAIARRILRFFSGLNEPPGDSDLTEREKEVLILLAKGLQRKEVADMLGITTNTVASYIKTIYKKLNISSRAEASSEATRLGLIHP